MEQSLKRNLYVNYCLNINKVELFSTGNEMEYDETLNKTQF